MRPGVDACGIIDVRHPHRGRDPLRRGRIHFLQHDDVGAAQRRVRLEGVDRAVDLLRVLEVERDHAQRRQRRWRGECDGLHRESGSIAGRDRAGIVDHRPAARPGRHYQQSSGNRAASHVGHKVTLLLSAGGPWLSPARLHQLPLQKLRRRSVHLHDVRIPQEMMRVVRNDEGLEPDSGGGKTADEVGAL